MNTFIITILVLSLSFNVLNSSKIYSNRKTFLYFAYGSNLLEKRIHLNNPSAKFLSSAKLNGYRLDFNSYYHDWRGAVATIVEDPDSEVWGALWILDSSDMKNLDKQEGVDVGTYYVKNVTVTTPEGNILVARTYPEVAVPPKVPSHDIPPERQPSITYMQVIAYGAFECLLPMHYIKFLFSFPTNGNVASWKLRQKLGRPFNETEEY